MQNLTVAAPERRLPLTSRLPFYYGWFIVGAAFIATFISNGTAFWGLQVFVGPMQDDTGWSRAAIMGALTVRWMVSALGGLVLGHVFDKEHGARRLLTVGSIVGGISLIALRWVDSAGQFLLVFGLIGGLASVGTGISSALIPKWFIARRGLALGIATSGSGISALVMFPLANALVESLGWRDAWLWMGILALVTMLPLSLLVRGSPEEIGLRPDNRPQSESGGRPAKPEEESLTLKEAMGSLQLWLLIVAMAVGLFSLSTNASSMVPHFKQSGFSAATAASAASVYGVASMLSRFVWGYAADRKGLRFAIALQTCLAAASVFLVLHLGGEATLYFAAAVQGFGLGGFLVLQPMVWPAFFGRLHLGSILGFASFFTAVGMAAGPLVAGAVFDASGDYRFAFWLLVVTWPICGALALLTPRRAGRQLPS